MKKSSILLSLIAAPFLIVGCGGGSSSTTTTNTMAKITGTVPGTLIEAYCDNNYYAQVTSTQNGTNEHPFEVSVPTNTNCRLVMTTNENDPANRIITPINFGSGNTIVLNKDINLGNVPLALDYQSSGDKDGDHVVDEPFDVDPSGASVNNAPVQDKDENGIVDNYDDDNGNNIPNAYEDYDNDGIVNIHDDANGNGVPDFDEENNGSDMNGGNENNSGNDMNGNEMDGGNESNNDMNGGNENNNG